MATSPIAATQSGATAQWNWSFAGVPTSITAIISDASGREIERRTLAPDATSLSWDGLLASGGIAPAGCYSLTLDARDASDKPVRYGSVRAVSSHR